jgi:hypothetical protein
MEVIESTIYPKRMDKLQVLMRETAFRIINGANCLEKFDVMFQEPVPIPARMWVDVAFQLEVRTTVLFN